MENPGQEALYIVVPCYNEQAVLPHAAACLQDKLARMIGQESILPESKILFVDDGSTDGTWLLIEELARKDPHIAGISLSRNKGHQNALLAGLMEARAHAGIVISMDADLQDPIDCLEEFLARRREGAHIVYGVRRSRKADSAFKKLWASVFYKTMRGLGADIVENHAEYRLMSKRALDALADFKEVNLFLRGIVPLLGFKTATVYYDRPAREAGGSKYSFRKQAELALEGITSFSIKPVRLIALLGGLILVACAGAGLLGLFGLWRSGAGNGGLQLSIWCACGLQLLGLGVVGEYVGKIYMETKGRPRYIIERSVNLDLSEKA